MGLNLEEIWENQMGMSKWISRQCLNSPFDVGDLKEQWLRENGFENVLCNCFFCHYDDGCDCSNCPGCLVDEDFDCTDDQYYFRFKPREFYAELKRLNKIRNNDVKL